MNAAVPRYRDEAVLSFQLAMAVFVLTVGIGLANATQVFGQLDRATIITHVHSGTLGFITMAVLGLVLLVFGGSAPAMSGGRARTYVILTGITTALYVLAFWTGNFTLRAVFGTLELLAIVGWWWFALSNARRTGFGRLTTPQYALFLSLTSLVIGSTFGALYQVLVVSGLYTQETAPGQTGGQIDLIGPHVTAQTTGYLILAAFAALDWRLRPGMAARDRQGDATIYLLFVAGIVTVTFLLAAMTQAVALANLLQLAAVVLFVMRFGGSVMRAAWGAATEGRYFAAAVPWLVANILLFITLVTLIIQANGDFTKVPPGIFPAFSHTIFIGVMTNVIFGTVHAQSGRSVWPWADHLVFWGVNLGLLGFVGALLADSGDLERIAAPIMGIAILLGIATFTRRLRGSRTAMAAATA